MRFLVYYIRSPLSTLYFNAPTAPNQHPTTCSHIPPPMPRHIRSYAAYNLSPIPSSAFPCPASLLNHTPHPLIQPQYPRSLLFIPSPIYAYPISSLPPNPFPLKTLARHSPTHQPTTLQPPPPIYTSFPCPQPHNTTQHNSYICPHE